MKHWITRGEIKMENKNFDLFENIDLTNEDKELFKYSNIVNEIIVQLISRRLDLKLSQRDLSEKTGIKQPMIARIEKFESVPRLDTLVRIATALGLKITFNEINDCTGGASIGIMNNSYINHINETKGEKLILCEDVTYNRKNK